MITCAATSLWTGHQNGRGGNCDPLLGNRIPQVFFFFFFFPCTPFNRSSCKLPLGLFRSLNLHSQITPLKRKLFSVFLRVFINKEGIFIVEQLVISSEHIQKK